MTMWAHLSFSERATWPPSAAVRQRSIALMTFIWPRLTWPALARRHAAPWSRKISATSNVGRGTAVGRVGRRQRFTLPRLLALRQEVEGAFDLCDHAGGDAGVAGGRVQLLVPEQRLND